MRLKLLKWHVVDGDMWQSNLVPYCNYYFIRRDHGKFCAGYWNALSLHRHIIPDRGELLTCLEEAQRICQKHMESMVEECYYA